MKTVYVTQRDATFTGWYSVRDNETIPILHDALGRFESITFVYVASCVNRFHHIFDEATRTTARQLAREDFESYYRADLGACQFVYDEGNVHGIDCTRISRPVSG